ncbi:MAG: helix-turn-helix transcriptional regulator [Alphaproteobacteria bacterium]
MGERDERLVLEALERLFDAGDLNTLAATVLDVTRQVIPCEHAGYNEVDTVNRRMLVRVSDDAVAELVAARHEALDHWFLAQHPVVNYFLEQPRGAPKAISDFVDLGAFRERELYQEFYKHLDMNDQLALHVGGHLDGYAAVAINRHRGGFSERDRHAAARLQRGFRFAYEALWLRETIGALTDASDMDRQYRLYRALGLTQRQAEVCAWLLQGKSNTEIAAILEMSPETAKRHAAAIYRRLGVPGRAGLQRAMLARLLRPAPAA